MSQGFAARPAPVTAPARSGRWRPAVAAVCLVLLGLVAPLAIVSLWTHHEIADTDRYVATVAPLARDPDVQDAVATRLTEEVSSRLATSGIPLSGALGERLDSQIRATVASTAFGTVWDTANRQAHRQLMALLTGEGSVARIQDDAVRIDLAAFIELVKQRLVAAGLPLAARIPTMHVEFTVFQARDLSVLQRVFRTLNDLAYVLPVIGLALLVLALALARSRRRTLLAAAVVVAVSMLLLWLALAVARYVYLDAVSAREISRTTAEAFYDAIVRFIRTSLLVVLASAVVVAALAALAGAVARRPEATRPS
ncbi:hypothetical protein P5P86_10465 [Nocardioides sp. BP30]|uniref:hypothetical protein n=1 Tax=Nocardioides sp. BP30 TaxID=3036374 RepID=UPI002468BD05|nr:hypothetical protein [Nocardioides sp. BP30]WGL50391.1 hypothetical protein P5P86_10465 [Nocardioides sp. BP30]